MTFRRIAAAAALSFCLPLSTLPAMAVDTASGSAGADAPLEHPEGLHVHGVYARASAASGAVFMLIHNNTDQDDRLVSVATDVAKKAELHTHLEGADGVMQMTEIEGGIALPAGEMHEFARGGDHVMLMGLTRKLQDGDSFDLILTFEKAGAMTVSVTVDNARKPGEGGMEMDHSGHQMGHGEGHSHQHGHSKD